MQSDTTIPLTGTSDDIADWIWSNLVPNSGQCDSVQGELLRAVEKLRSEAYRNANANWDSGFEMFVDYLQQTLCSEPAFSNAAKESIAEDLASIHSGEFYEIDDGFYDGLVEHIIAFCRLHPQLIHRQHDERQHR